MQYVVWMGMHKLFPEYAGHTVAGLEVLGIILRGTVVVSQHDIPSPILERRLILSDDFIRVHYA
jgi:hypothetical protein